MRQQQTQEQDQEQLDGDESENQILPKDHNRGNTARVRLWIGGWPGGLD